MAVPDLQDAIDHLQQKNLDAAIRTLEQKIEELPAHLTAHVLLARAYEAKRQWNRSLKCWENVRFLMPNSPVGREGKQRVLRRLEDPDETDSEESESAPKDSGAAPSAEEPTADTDEASADEEDEDADEDSPTTATEAVSELEQLRRQAEEEAREGGARPELADTPTSASESPPAGDGSSDTPEERVDQLEREGDDLDRLIDELESARIEPRPDVDDVPPPDLDNDVDDIVSETLARIHEAQDKYRKAAQIYVKLASQEPDRAREYLQKAAEMREKAEQKAEQEPPD
jgi:hypothetical protein